MKKNIRSKRYLRSRATVEVVRQARRTKKIKATFMNLEKGLSRMLAGVISFSSAIEKAGKEIALAFRIPAAIIDYRRGSVEDVQHTTD